MNNENLSLYYSAVDMGHIICDLDLRVGEAGQMLEDVWANDFQFMAPEYREDKRHFFLEAYRWADYLSNWDTLDREFSQIQRIAQEAGSQLADMDELLDQYYDVNYFFKRRRVQILYLDGKDYVKFKLRTLLDAYGYKRRTQELVNHFYTCLAFYHMWMYTRGNEGCDIANVPLDTMITLRVV